MKLLGIDYGRRRIGIAATDETGLCIHGCTTIDQKKCSDPISALSDIIAEESPGAIVFGVPLGPNDEETVMSQEIRAFAKCLTDKIFNQLPVYFVDESFSSREAQKQLRFRKKKQRRSKENINKFAACNILVSFQRQQQCGHL